MTRGTVWEFEDEGNNVAAAALPVGLDVPPDLQVTALSSPERVVRGQPFDVTWTVTNLGGDTPPDQGSWEILIYLSRDEVLDLKADRYLASQGHSGGLGAAESDTRTVTVTAPKELLGPYYVFTVADPTIWGCSSPHISSPFASTGRGDRLATPRGWRRRMT